MMSSTFEECEAKLKSIGELLEREPVDWEQARILRDELSLEGPKRLFNNLPEGTAPPKNDVQVACFTVAMMTLETALNNKNRVAAEEELAKTKAALATLKRRPRTSRQAEFSDD